MARKRHPRLEALEATAPTLSPQIYIRIKNDPEIRTYLQLADEHTAAIGYTEHGLRHATLVAANAAYILSALGYDQEKVELARIAGFLHDIGNMMGRDTHPQMGAVLCYQLLSRFGLTPRQRGMVMSAVGNHEEGSGQPVNEVSAAVIIADKSDVHRTRVREWDEGTDDIHDRVNYACVRAELNVSAKERSIELNLIIDTNIASLLDYFEIFTERMVMCKTAARFIGCEFYLVINGVRLG